MLGTLLLARGMAVETDTRVGAAAGTGIQAGAAEIPAAAAVKENGTAAPGPAVPGINGHRLITVPAGEYRVGGKGRPLNPPRTVRLTAYRIADAETTNAQFAVFVAATAYKTDAERRGSAHIFKYGLPEWKWLDTPGACWRFPQGPDGTGEREGSGGHGGPDAVRDLPEHPVTCLSAADAEAYARWAGGRLPTQSEWETAARAGADTDFPWGAEFNAALANTWDGVTHARNSKADGWEFTAPVRRFPPNRWGLYDVIGNVFEFVSDLPVGIPVKPEQPLTSARGGSWWCSARTCHAFNLLDNGTMPKHGSLPNQGFRMVFDEGNAKTGK